MTDTLKSIAVAVPQYVNGASLKAFLVKLQGYFKVMGISSDKEQLAILPLCFPGSKFDSIWELIDGRSTLQSVLDRLEAFVQQEDRPVDPLMNFIDRKWLPHETVFDFIRDLKKRAKFITTHSTAIDDMVRLQLIRCAPDSVRPVVSTSNSLDDIAELLASISPPDIASTVSVTSAEPRRPTAVSRHLICFNCDRPGHTTRRCQAKRAVCSLCGKFWHLPKHCNSKNGLVGPL